VLDRVRGFVMHDDVQVSDGVVRDLGVVVGEMPVL
jgi:hypothetical protein